jgi:aryl-alcohol dehydrogenase-like predicted oxidoreductase
MAWILGSPYPNVPIVGAGKVAHLDIAVDSLKLKLDPKEREFIDEPYRPRDEINDQQALRRARAYRP